MKKLVLGLVLSDLTIGSVSVYQSKPVAEQVNAAVAPCIDHNADPTKRYLGGRMIHRETRQPMKDVRVILISLPWSWRDWTNEHLPLPKAIEYETFTNAQGEFWFCGLATRNDITWGVTPSHASAYVRPTVIYYFEKRKNLGKEYENFFEMTPFGVGENPE